MSGTLDHPQDWACFVPDGGRREDILRAHYASGEDPVRAQDTPSAALQRLGACVNSSLGERSSRPAANLNSDTTLLKLPGVQDHQQQTQWQ